MILFLISSAAVAVVLLPIDAVWLGLVARRFYADQLGNLMLAQPRLGIAAIFYVLYAAGLAFFAVMPNLQGGTIWTAAAYGAALGLLAYGTYDVTNYATLKGFPLTLMLADWAWGTLLSAVAAAGGFWLVQRFWLG